MTDRVGANFKTVRNEDAVPEATILIPASSTPSDLSNLINHILENDGKIEFMFFLNGTVLTKTIADELLDRNLSMVDYQTFSVNLLL